MSTKTPSRYHFPSPGFTNYWNEGRGRKLAQKINGVFPKEEEIQRKIPLLFQVDELADKVIREVMIPNGYPKTMQWINEALDNRDFESLSPRENLSSQEDSSTSLTTSIPQILIDLIEFSIQKPSWLDLEKVELGAKLCRRSGTRGFMVLRNYCLMGGYESSAINKPLIFTGALKKGAAKRTTETTDFWVKVVGERALENPQNGIRECILIRLMHAYARVSILKSEHHKWKTEDWGEPLNQWDMVATNLGFSLVFLDGIRSLGVNVKPEEAEGLFHLWKYIGYLLGIPVELLPETEEQAIRELYAWTITQPPADADTQELARALMLEPFSSNFPPNQWQKKRVVQLHLAYNYFFLGAESCKAMGLPIKGWTIYPALLKNITKVQEWYYNTSSRAFEKGVNSRRTQQVKVARLYLEGAKQNQEDTSTTLSARKSQD